jgi:hypothetical protein
VQNGRQIDLSAQVERVKRKTRPWKAIIASLFAIAAGVLSRQARHDSGIFSATNGTTNQLIAAGLAVAFLSSGRSRPTAWPGRSGNCSSPRWAPRTRRWPVTPS